MYIVIAIMTAAPMTLLVRRSRAWPWIAAGIAARIVATGILALVLGYGRALFQSSALAIIR
jgi:hypothetical protein